MKEFPRLAARKLQHEIGKRQPFGSPEEEATAQPLDGRATRCRSTSPGCSGSMD